MRDVLGTSLPRSGGERRSDPGKRGCRKSPREFELLPRWGAGILHPYQVPRKIQ
jgi:hypothetical protein